MASFTHDTLRGRKVAGRPSFSSMKTSDRLRECELRPACVSKIAPARRSIFREEGLDDLNTTVHLSHPSNKSPTRHSAKDQNETKTSSIPALRPTATKGEDESTRSATDSPWYWKIVKGSRSTIKGSSTAPPASFSSVSRVAMIAFLLAVVIPGFRYSTGEGHNNISGADAGVIRSSELVENGSRIEGRANSPTDTCTRWAHQSTNVNGTLYIYGGQSKSKAGQTSGTWNNNLLTLDLTKSWEIDSPSLNGLTQPSGPPSISMGALWNSYNSLFVYGGYFSDTPPTSPLPVSTWEYNIKSTTWTEHADPVTSAGNASEGGNIPVQRSAEGASLSVPEIGKSWYFGGHLDEWTTPGWSNQIYRVYLKSFLEFTHPGYANTGVSSLGSSKAAGSDGVYRNITEGGLQDTSGFAERADGVLVYVPGWGTEGIILGLAGGTNQSFNEMNIIDVFDIANSIWYKQSTSGTTPQMRVNPCAVVAAASDGTSFNVYLYGGQNLLPFGSQIQTSDMWILTIPSFTWIQVDMDGQSIPPARAGHTCTIWDGQMIVVGGYVGKDISCDSPGIYVFNATSLQWSTSFKALSGGSTSSNSENTDSSIFQGSYGYGVPAPVQSIIGGGPAGGATATMPAVGSATAGPIATGRPPTYTVTQSGSTIVQTSVPTSANSPQPAKVSKNGPNVGAISAGVAAAVLAILAGYLAFCTWLYRRQLKQYKDHVSMAQRRELSPLPWGAAGGGGRHGEKSGVMLGPFGTDISNSGPSSAGRPSYGSNVAAAPSLGPSSGSTPSSVEPVPPIPAGYGGGFMPGGGTAGKGYEHFNRNSDEHQDTEYLGVGGSYGRPSGSTTNSSTEDLLGGQEPSFFSVVLNPRRTLRVVNND
ncbi:hypothetical protein BJ875DRAFT_30869 [Amylocarpus encephaloides]|uniref:Kelch repeat-containing protein n=1 Tax=Amylocarpus encephaloides TaxID=45428 RepID=A0A9P8C6B8_9HELO|nr:hypothetical protein BJ875DRAFT_30869 [Amylocarpus encephaloides]